MKDYFGKQLTDLRSAGRFREFKPLTERSGCRIQYKEKEMLNLSSNDYLGLAGSWELHRRFYAELGHEGPLDGFGLGAASSRLLTGDSAISHELELLLETSYQREAALLFNSGYHANIGILPALLNKRDLILSDKLNHASITDGMRLSPASYKRFRHCDYEHLRWLLEKYRTDYDRVIIVSESVFSMDGDVADLEQLVELKLQFDSLLYIDEAHSIGLYGVHGLGIAEEQGQLENIDLLIGTFGKALASVGAFVLCSQIIKDYLVNTSRSLIFTTALPPVVINWNLFVFQEILKMKGKRKKLCALSAKLREDLLAHNLKTDGATNIVPVMLGSDTLAISLASQMQEEGYLIFPVRPPTVPEGTSRFRLSLTADMVWDDLKDLAPAIASGLNKRAVVA